MAAIRLPLKQIASRIQALRARITASQFKPEVTRHASRVLSTCVKLTPVRSASLITRNQKKQYLNRINYIPSFHQLIDPTLIVNNDTGEFWLYVGGKWYNATWQNLPAQVQSALGELEAERDRRMNTSREEFVAFRVQARFLYQKSWTQVARSAGVSIEASGDVLKAVSRRTESQINGEYKAEQPKGYAQWRGGKDTLTIVVYNPFLEQPSQYKDFSGKDILAESIKINQPKLLQEAKVKFDQLARQA
jgi:hypothetical protein